MIHRVWRWALGLSFAAAVSLLAMGQGARPQEPLSPPGRPEDTRLPNGKMQKDEILKAEYEQNLKDAAQLAELAQQLQQDLEKDDRYVLSMSTLKKTDDIEKLAKKIRGRLRHY